MARYTLVGVDGNAFAVMGYVTEIMKREHFSKAEIAEYLAEAKKSDYNHLLCTSMDYVEKCNKHRFNK